MEKPLNAITDPLAALKQCESEPIHIPGAIQPHGVLLAMHGPSLRITQASASCQAILGVAALDLLESDLATVLGAPLANAVQEALVLNKELPDVAASFEWQAGSGSIFSAFVHHSDGQVILEMEGPSSKPSPPEWGLGPAARVIARMRAQAEVPAKAQFAAEWLRQMTGYDRVMVYRFHEDWHGEVIAEARRPDLEPYLGLHYPDSDIPAQARRMYLLSPTRVIIDVGYTPSPILPTDNPITGQPLDLSHSTLRSVSPIHLVYLRNMGVGATLVTSLLRDGRLWGLISCHHYAPHPIPRATREIADWTAQTLATQIALTEDADSRRYAAHLKQCRDNVVQAVRGGRRLPALLSGPECADFLGAVGAEGAAVIHGAEVTVGGLTPDPQRICQIVSQLDDCPGQAARKLFVTNCLSQFLPEAADLAPTAAGLGMFPLDPAENIKLVWFRGEQLRSVRWGGNPDKAMNVTADGRLSPRTSFASWTESVRLRSTPWRPEELESAHELGAMIDIEWRRIAEDARLFSEIMLTDVVDSLTAHIAVLDSRGVIVRVNRAWRDFAAQNLGSESCLPGADYLAICRHALGQQEGADASAALQGIGDILSGQKNYFSLEYPCHSPTEQRWFVMRAFALGGALQGAVVAHDNITSQKQLGQELRRERQRYQTLLTISQDGIHLLDAAGTLVEASDTFLNSLGQPREAVGQLNVVDWDAGIPPDQLPHRLDQLLQKPGLFQTTHRRLDGSLLEVEVHAGRVDLDGRPFLLASSRDITARKALEQQLLHKQALLEELNQSLEERVSTAVAELRSLDQMLITQSRQAAMGEMIGNIAHQWRQPLNALSLLIANIGDAQVHGVLDEEYLAHSLQQVNDVIRRMSSTITDFRDFFRPNKDRVFFSVRQQIEQTVALLQVAFQVHNITLRVDAPAQLNLLGMPNEYSQVILNLLSNAKDALLSRQVKAGLVDIGVTTSGRDCVLTVRDNGGGISEDVIGKIFDPYFSTREAGTGIGLYMSKMIVEQSMKGRIEARNIPGGAEFAVICPLLEEAG